MRRQQAGGWFHGGGTERWGEARVRKFDYRHLPKDLFDGAVGTANVRLYEDKGKLDVLERIHPERLRALEEVTHASSVDASMHIEGLYVDRARARDLLQGADPEGELESQFVGGSAALHLIEREWRSLELETSTIVRLYEELYRHRDLGRKSRYRKKDYAYVQVDGHMQAMPVSPVSAFETPLVLGGACDSLADAFNANACSPLILNAVFTVDFLCIRPFDEGNGRIARLFSDLMLMKAGFTVSRYVSVERFVEDTAMEYYDALNACVDKWDRGRNDYSPYALYWLGVLHRAHEELFARVDITGGMQGGKSERVRELILGREGDVTKRQLLEALPDVSEATVENVLGKMVREGALQKVGAGRTTSYRRSCVTRQTTDTL